MRPEEYLLAIVEVSAHMTEGQLACVRDCLVVADLTGYEWDELGEAFCLFDAVRFLGGPWEAVGRHGMSRASVHLHVTFGAPDGSRRGWADRTHDWLQERRGRTGPRALNT